MYNSVFSGWLADILNVWFAIPYDFRTLLIILFCMAVLFCITGTLRIDLADKQDILADKYNDPYSFYDGTYELPRTNIFKAMCYANLSYHTFWNAVVLYRYRLCLHTCPQIYFRVNKFYELGMVIAHVYVIIRPVMFLSLAFIWGYPIFLIVMLIRLLCYDKNLY